MGTGSVITLTLALSHDGRGDKSLSGTHTECVHSALRQAQGERMTLLDRTFANVLLQAGVGDDRLGGEQVAEGGKVGEAEYLGDAVVEALSRGAVGHSGQALELLLRQRVEEVGEALKLGGREAARVEDGKLFEVGFLHGDPAALRTGTLSDNGQ